MRRNYAKDKKELRERRTHAKKVSNKKFEPPTTSYESNIHDRRSNACDNRKNEDQASYTNDSNEWTNNESESWILDNISHQHYTNRYDNYSKNDFRHRRHRPRYNLRPSTFLQSR